MKKNNLFAKVLNKVNFNIVKDSKGRTRYEIWKQNFDGEFVKTLTTSKLEKALHTKHNAWLEAIHSLGKTGMLLERRKKRKKS